MDTKQLKVGSLLLDARNPRNPPVDAQDEAIEALIAEQGSKLVELMKDIAAHGMSPTDRLLVIQDGRRFIVLEGNRRVAALKILDNPDLAAGTAIARQAKRIARDREVVTDRVDCAVAASREEARPWIKPRHDGESDGAGTVRWGGRQRARFGSDSSSQSAVGNNFLNAVERGYEDDPEIVELAEQVGSKRLTTLGRVVQGPDFRKWASCVIDRMAWNRSSLLVGSTLKRTFRSFSLSLPSMAQLCVSMAWSIDNSRSTRTRTLAALGNSSTFKACSSARSPGRRPPRSSTVRPLKSFSAGGSRFRGRLGFGSGVTGSAGASLSGWASSRRVAGSGLGRRP